MRYVSLFVIILVAFMIVLPAAAETFVLRDGEEIEGDILRRIGRKVTLMTKTGVSTYDVMEFDEKTRDEHFEDLEKAIVRRQMRSSTPSKAKPTPMTGWMDLGEAKDKAVLGLMIAGSVLCLIGSLWFIIAGFAESVLWGIVLIFFNGIAGLAFLILHWDRAKPPFLIGLLGLVLWMTAVLMNPQAAWHMLFWLLRIQGQT